jgi:hypothetical protein
MKWVIIALVVALLGSNAWWLYMALGEGIAAAYREQTCAEHQEALVQALAIIRLAKGRRARNEMTAAARAAVPQLGEPFEKDGETVIGRLTLKFDPDGALIYVQGPP